MNPTTIATSVCPLPCRQVRNVIEGSAAAAAGARAGMRLLAIDGVRAASLSVREVQRQILGALPASPVHLQLVPATADAAYCTSSESHVGHGAARAELTAEAAESDVAAHPRRVEGSTSRGGGVKGATPASSQTASKRKRNKRKRKVSK